MHVASIGLTREAYRDRLLLDFRHPLVSHYVRDSGMRVLVQLKVTEQVFWDLAGVHDVEDV